MQITCENCGTLVPAENVNLDKLLAKCRACDAVFAFRVEGGTDDGTAESLRSDAPRPRENIARPAKLQVEQFGDETIVRRRWRNLLIIGFLVFFAVMWNGIVWGGYAMTGDDEVVFFRWFLIPFQLIGLVIPYIALALLLNTTTLTVSRARLTVRHGPLPFPGNVDLDATEIEQVFVDEQLNVHRSDNSATSTMSRSFRLHARMKDGTKKMLLRVVPEADEALWLEQLIEDKIGIVDRPVRGEYR